eukprot:CAMPEP_0174732876 /NCGR_PEP_ID=MMETSP1094-20130205/60172_1 /TAXON_ID=156173 /ORGANISM="Chrysochromulina brevifilum, Strain UTEX LB 985" /LENGTH=179 /DNA_ID=CAMNT_0015935435 /DNA_START=179 /DNA_END=718 /DNA_ORIENTATION=+
MEPRADGWNDVRQGIKDRKKPWSQFKACTITPAIRLGRSVVGVSRTLLSRQFWTTGWPELSLSDSNMEAEAVEAHARPCEPVPLTANTIFTLADRDDGWNDVREGVRRYQPAMAGISLAMQTSVATAVWAREWAKLRAWELFIVTVACATVLANAYASIVKQTRINPKPEPLLVPVCTP